MAAEAAMEPTMEDWFHSAVDPRSPLATYIHTPPRGMTVTPQSDKVRKELL
eukprot:CAMPEP_0171140176 /NCGR_PEP_ID=MMETSP0766_2-20121228/138202_1 /TAXON_ID=439317 /ORGANISM="Gambierdiscus australes, Strain CAWD 149" /LENGTH=50 /DNA_ID=CAMNT_0011603859 /DNA_START=32 /DNA_END=180 /DNA_ORIENTATION=+